MLPGELANRSPSRPEWQLEHDGTVRASSQRPPRRAQRLARTRRRRRRLALSVTAIATVAAFIGALPDALAGGGSRVLAPGTYARPLGGDVSYSRFDLAAPAGYTAPHLGFRVKKMPNLEINVATRSRKCPLLAQADGYVNPLAHAHVISERIDQGVDYAGSGTLVAIGTARVIRVASSGSGWPGAFIELRLLDGADSGCYVYYAEGVTPVAGVRAGHTVHAGQAVATIIRWFPTGIELGWAAGVNTTSYAAKYEKWTSADDADNVPTAAGKSFSALIAAAGGPPGKAEGPARSGARSR